MSFMDPDLRESLARDAEFRREQCRKAGAHQFRGDRRAQCGAIDPISQQPHVTLKAGDYRAVWRPSAGRVEIEKRSTDSLGSERWDHVQSISSSHHIDGSLLLPVYELLTKGAKP